MHFTKLLFVYVKTEKRLLFAVVLNENGELSEWLKEHAWKACISQGIESSNLSLSADGKPDCLSGFSFFNYELKITNREGSIKN